jgi:hypothetical protein
MAVAAPGVMVPRRKWVNAGRCGGGQQTSTSMQAAQFTSINGVSMSCEAVDSRSWQCVQMREVPTIPGRACVVLRRGGGAREWNGVGGAERAESRTARRRRLQARDWWQGGIWRSLVEDAARWWCWGEQQR